MDVGLYFDLRNPPLWQRSWSRTYGFALEMCEEADRLGADSVWLSEHHGFEDGYLPQPLTMAAAVAARTRRLRIGTAVLLAPLRHAVHIAEQAAVVDAISGGRLELGLGAGYRVSEFELFGVDHASRYRTTDAAVRTIRQRWADATVRPPPTQPRVPIWLGYNGPTGARRAGLLGEGLLSLERHLLPPYLDGLREGGHGVADARMGGVVNAFTTDDPERDWPTIAMHYRYQSETYAHYTAEGADEAHRRLLPSSIDPEHARAEGLGGGRDGLLVGTPAGNAEQIRAHLADLPVRTVFFWVSLAGMPDEVVVRHVQAICTSLRPLLADADRALSGGDGRTS
jgi:alkanesulfonate monooxygenase SsuD/methylene tetrahydromethanopterin reductase-like flavin-dependent oxidoreductase (luciferase family)